ncbi:hypothetical protein R1flu_017987 [Riccia fluitans]|uniref:Uncharacterized protein n=1 Tax=Riccia fluitans TaxID=41844 RepID=A0ABD1ZEJ0_9MARC
MGPGGKILLVASLMLWSFHCVRGSTDLDGRVESLSGACCKNLAKPVKFTVHGLWPENEDGSYPSCCTGPGFDEDKISELHEFLVKSWPTLSCHSPKQCHGGTAGRFGFWKHESSFFSSDTLPFFRLVYMVVDSVDS